MSGVFLNDRALTDIPKLVDKATTLTLMGFTSPDDTAPLEPAIDVNLDLMERRIALLSHFNAFPPAQWPSRLTSGADGISSSSVTEDRTDSSASFLSGSIRDDLDNDPASQLPLWALGTATTTTATISSSTGHTSVTTTPAPAMDSFGLDSPRPRHCNIVSTPADVTSAHVCIFAACGHSPPTQINTLRTIRAADILSRCTSTFSNMSILPDVALDCLAKSPLASRWTVGNVPHHGLGHA